MSEQPVQIGQNAWWVPGKEQIIGFGGQEMQTANAKVISRLEGPVLYKPPQTPLDWLREEVNNVCRLAH